MITASRISDGRASVRFRMKRWKLRPKLRQPSENASANFSPNVRCSGLYAARCKCMPQGVEAPVTDAATFQKHGKLVLAGTRICGLANLPGPMTPWGKPAMGLKTRKAKNRTNKFIFKRRNAK